ncbi:MAG: hypothetical protein HY307_00840 [Arcobacter sp.]|nr:hypothetical protein [Arcobacter sp.]
MNTISQKGFVYLISFMIFFHLFLILDLFPKDFAVEIPRIKTQAQFYGTLLSVIINSCILFIVSIKARLIESSIKLSNEGMNSLLWIIFAMFLITSMGYLNGTTFFENYILSIVSFFLAYFTMLITLNKE